MKKFLFFVMLVPVFANAQVKKATVKKVTTSKNVIAKKSEVIQPKVTDGFFIDANVSGYENGTSVMLIDANSGAPEATTKMENGKFTFSGKMAMPDFRVIVFNEKPPYITLFLDNSTVSITGKRDALDDAVVKGSPSNDEYTRISKIVNPYQKLFTGEIKDSVSAHEANIQLTKFIQQNPGSFLSPIAAYRIYQLNENNDQLEKLYNILSNTVRQTPNGTFINKLISENKINPVGQPLADFSQADTAGNSIALSSFKGKYVLVDFWASWCGPCRHDNPNVVNLYNMYKDKNFTILGVSLDKSKQAWLEAIKMDALAWTHVSDLQGWNNSVAQKFQIYKIPQNFLLDPNGNIVAKNLHGAALENKLRSLLQ